MNHDELVKKIDPNLTYCEHLTPSTLFVRHVKKKGQDCVLKIAYEHDNNQIKHAVTEIKALELAKNISGITHLIQTYPKAEHYFTIFLKKYITGKTPNIKELRNAILQRKLERIVTDLHSLGIAYLDIGIKNAIISPNNQIYIVDLGGVRFGSDLSKEDFEFLKKEDLEDMYKIFY